MSTFYKNQKKKKMKTRIWSNSFIHCCGNWIMEIGLMGNI